MDDMNPSIQASDMNPEFREQVAIQIPVTGGMPTILAYYRVLQFTTKGTLLV
jgi:hypothetical protein